MKAVILAGGFGTRLSEETDIKPKPMVEVGGRPILWHIMKMYSCHGIKDFIICLGYKGYVIKEFFVNYQRHMSDITVNLKDGTIEDHKSRAEDWNVTLVDTGLNTMTGGRIKGVQDFLKDEEDFCLTYGDGVSDVDITKLIEFHKSHNKIATLTSVKAPNRFGVIDSDKTGLINSFKEKPQEAQDWINGGFFVLNKRVFDYMNDDKSLVFESDVLPKITQDKELTSFRHDGFWQAMDTKRDNITLNDIHDKGKAPWVKW